MDASSTVQTASDAVWTEVPVLWANTLYTAIWGLAMLLHAGIGIWYKQWWFMTCIVIGCALEFIGYLARAVASQQPDNVDAFLAQISSLILGPAFIMAGVYFILAKMVMIYGRQYSVLPPMYYTAIFCSCDLLSIVIQAIGGGMASSAFQATPQENPDSGTNVMVAGMAVQVASMTLFMFFFCLFYYKVARASKTLQPGQTDSVIFTHAHADIRERRAFRYLPYAVAVSVTFVYIRCIYRVIELAGGWSGTLMTHEIYADILDGLMCFIAVVTVLIAHPGFAFGSKIIPVDGLHKRELVERVHMGSKEFNEGEEGVEMESIRSR